MKALIGAWDSQPHKLLAEITALRSKIARLEGEIADLESENAMLRSRLEQSTEPVGGELVAASA